MLTQDEIARQRKLVADEALSWTGTPYHPNAQVKGAGCDCLTLVVAAFSPVVDYGPVPHYSKEWHLHHSAELYLSGIPGDGKSEPFKGILDYCVEVAGPAGEFGGEPGRAAPRAPMAGDVVIWKFGRCFSHGAVVVRWPLVMHAYSGLKAGQEDAERAPYLKTIGHGEPDKGKRRLRRFFALKTWMPAMPGDA